MDEQPLCNTVFAERYAQPGEASRADVFHRVAHALSLAEPAERRAQVERAFFVNLQRGAIGAGRILANAGADNGRTMINCFVHPLAIPADTPVQVVDTALEHALADARITLLMGGGIGYDFSPVPPADAYERHQSSGRGACAAIDRFDAMCEALPFTGPRRGGANGCVALRSSGSGCVRHREARTIALADVQPVGRRHGRVHGGGPVRPTVGARPSCATALRIRRTTEAT